MMIPDSPMVEERNNSIKFFWPKSIGFHTPNIFEYGRAKSSTKLKDSRASMNHVESISDNNSYPVVLWLPKPHMKDALRALFFVRRII